jgi:hypothetical protein
MYWYRLQIKWDYKKKKTVDPSTGTEMKAQAMTKVAMNAAWSDLLHPSQTLTRQCKALLE